jgi:hypothetical protein
MSTGFGSASMLMGDSDLAVGDTNRTADDDAREFTGYRGALGTTRSRVIRIRDGHSLIGVEVYVSVNADTHPELGARARGEDSAEALHGITIAGAALEVAMPLLYHEPCRELFVLVLPIALRHREIEERIELYRQLQTESAATPIPSYVLNFDVAVGAESLRDVRARPRSPAATAMRDDRTELHEAELREAELETWQRELELRAAELEQRTGALVRREAALQERQRRFEARLHTAQPPDLEAVAGVEYVEYVEYVEPPWDSDVAKESDAIPTTDTIDDELSAGLSSAAAGLAVNADPVTTEARDEAIEDPDHWLASVMLTHRCDLRLEKGQVRIALASSAVAEVKSLLGPLDVRVVLHRVASYPVIALLFGSPMELRGERSGQVAALCLDLSSQAHRDVLAQLAQRFELTVDLFDQDRWMRRTHLSAPLADNITYLLRAADTHLRLLRDSGACLSAAQACDEVAHTEFDATSAPHRNSAEFRDRQLVQIASADQLRLALPMAQRFARPEGEDYLICVRGFPLQRWRRLRRHVLDRAVIWGIWMGHDLARIAVSEGLARSRRDLVQRMLQGFEMLKRHPTAFDLDDAAVAENAAALDAEAVALGVVAGKRGAIDSELDSVVAGTIDLMPSGPVTPLAQQSGDALLAALDEPATRVAAALELCARGVAAAAEPLVAAVANMSRADAVTVLAMCMRLGPAIERPLILALANSKSYIRQGAALVLSLLHSESGVAAVVDLLLHEPTEIWKEVASALGQVGPLALHHLALAVPGQRISATMEERVAWALAHLGAHTCHHDIAQISRGHSVMAPIAGRALALIEPAMRAGARRKDGGPESTVSQQFSSQFFAALAASPAAASS